MSIFPEHLRLLIGDELERAESLYPRFTDTVLALGTSLGDIRDKLNRFRARSDAEKTTGFSIENTLMEEVYEVLEAFALHDKEASLLELAGVITVCLRAMKALNKGEIQWQKK